MKKLIGLFVVTLGIFALAGFASASTAEVLQPAGGGTTNLESLRIGTAGEGGVTFFNGSILNEGADTPLTVADDLRVDGAIWRGETAGPGGSMPIKLNDDVRVYGDLTVDGDITGEVTSATGTSMPIAYGVCDSSGSLTSGTSNVSSCSWDGGEGSYAITIDEETLTLANYVLSVTPIDENYIPATIAHDGQMLVKFVDHDGTGNKQTGFYFIVYKH